MFNDLVEFCMSNLAAGSYEAMDRLEADPNLDVVEYDCMNHCTLCACSLYALVNGEIVTGETPDELVDQIYKKLEKEREG